MKLNYCILLLCFLLGCTYVSTTLFVVKGTNVKSAYVSATNAEVIVNRTTNYSFWK
jgi:hypothetical protein